MKFIYSILLVIALTACSTTAPRVQEVLVPIQVPCKIDKPTKPDFAVDTLGIDANIFEKVKALLAERKQRMGYEKELEVLIDRCK